MRYQHGKIIQTRRNIRQVKKEQDQIYKEPYQCDKCEYKTKNKTTMMQHKLNEHGTKEEMEHGFKHYCSICDYGTFSADLFDAHKKK